MQFAKELYLDPKYYHTHYKLKMIQMACNFNYYFVVMNIGNITGNMFRVGIAYGLSEMMGVYIGEPLVKKLPEITAFKYSMSMVMFLNILIQMVPDLTEELSIVLFNI